MLHDQVAQQLANLHEDVLQEITQLNEYLTLCAEEYRALTEKIETLYSEREAILSQKREEERRRNHIIVTEREQGFTIVTDSLRSAYEQMSSQTVDSGKLTDLRLECERMLSEDPSLTDTFKEVEEFEQSNKETLDHLPETYRQAVRQAHAKNLQRIAPLLEIKRQIEELESTTVIETELLLFMAVEPGLERIHWLTPWLANGVNPWDFKQHRDSLLLAASNAFLTLIGAEDWEVHEMESSIWSGFLCFSADANYSGSNSIQGAVETLLTNYLAPLKERIHRQITVKIVPMREEIWKLLPVYPLEGWNESSSIDETASEVPTQFVTAESEPSDQELPNGELTVDNVWIEPQDLVAWNRPLKTGKESRWSHQARRMRTLLMRLMARGEVMGRGVEIEELCNGLPEPHQSKVRLGIERLLEAEILGYCLYPESNEDEELSITIRSEKLEDVQFLINRQITPLWEQILA